MQNSFGQENLSIYTEGIKVKYKSWLIKLWQIIYQSPRFLLLNFFSTYMVVKFSPKARNQHVAKITLVLQYPINFCVPLNNS